MEKRPKIEIKLTQTDKILEAIGYSMLVIYWVMTIVSFSTLPENIPIHYNGLGEVDNYGGKASIFLLPIIGTFLFTILTVLNKNPENFNYNVEINEENAEKQYTNSTKMMRLMKLIVVFIFLMIDYLTIQTSKGNSEGLGKWFLPLTFGLIFIPMGYFAYKSHKFKK